MCSEDVFKVFVEITLCLLPFLQETSWSSRAIIIFSVIWIIIATTALSLTRWEYMWIVLVALTLIFLFACVYHAYKVKKAHEERLAHEQQTRTRIQTISDLTDYVNHRETDCRTQLSTDLPPSYASVVSAPPTASHVRIIVDRSDEKKVEEPPSYSLVIASTNSQDRNAAVSSESNVSSFAPTKKDSAFDNAATSVADVRDMRNS